MQKHVNLVDLVKTFRTSIYLQKSASIQPRTSRRKFSNLVIVRQQTECLVVFFSLECGSGGHHGVPYTNIKHNLWKFKKLGFCAVVSLPPTKGPVYGLDCGRPAWGDLVVEVALDEAEEGQRGHEAVGPRLMRLADAHHLRRS